MTKSFDNTSSEFSLLWADDDPRNWGPEEVERAHQSYSGLVRYDSDTGYMSGYPEIIARILDEVGVDAPPITPRQWVEASKRILILT